MVTIDWKLENGCCKWLSKSTQRNFRKIFCRPWKSAALGYILDSFSGKFGPEYRSNGIVGSPMLPLFASACKRFFLQKMSVGSSVRASCNHIWKQEYDRFTVSWIHIKAVKKASLVCVCVTSMGVLVSPLEIGTKKEFFLENVKSAV